MERKKSLPFLCSLGRTAIVLAFHKITAFSGALVLSHTSPARSVRNERLFSSVPVRVRFATPFGLGSMMSQSLPRCFMSLIPEQEETMDDNFDGEEEDDYCQVVDDFGCLAMENVTEEANQNAMFRWVRVEKEIDPSIVVTIKSRKHVMRKISQVHSEQSKFGRADLYHRQWEKAMFKMEENTGRLLDSGLFHEAPAPLNGNSNSQPVNDETSLSGGMFTVMQLNALAEGLSSGPNSKKPFTIDSSNNYKREERLSDGFGGFTGIPCPEVTLDFSLRRWRLVEAMFTSAREQDDSSSVDESGCDDSKLFDIIALEEIDRYRGFFQPILRLFGYNSLFIPKPRSPCVGMGWYSDGCCLAWKDSKFQLRWEHRGQFTIGNQVFIIAAFRHKATGRAIITAVTHLKANKQPENEEIRCTQVKELLTVISGAVERVKQEDQIAPAVLILGDFNAEPPCAPTSTSPEKDKSSVQRILNHSLPHCGPIESAYPGDPASLQKYYTTWKIRGSQEARRVIDYIFYSSKVLTCESTLQIPAESELEDTKLPGLRYPSDHMLIAGRFLFND